MMWMAWDYDGKYLGTVAADSLGVAMRAARAKWPERLPGNALFDIVPVDIDATTEDLFDVIRNG